MKRTIALLILIALPGASQAQSVGQIEALQSMMAKNDAQLEWCRVNTPVEMKGCIARRNTIHSQLLDAYSATVYPRGTAGLSPIPPSTRSETTCIRVGQNLNCKTVGQ